MKVRWRLARIGCGARRAAILTGLALLSPPVFGGPGWSVGGLGAQERPIPLDTLEVEVGSRVSVELPVLTRSVQLLQRDDIAALPVRTVSGLLGWATGVEILSRSPAQSDLSIRGGGFEQVVVLVNGVRMSDPQTGHFDLDLAVPLDQVERVEILRGPASALYGADAVGGVVNVVTRSGGTPWTGRVEGGSWGTGRLSLGGGVGEPDGAFLQGGGELARSDGHRGGTDFETALVQLRASAPLAAGRLAVDLGSARRDFGAKDFYAPYPSFEKTRTQTASARWTSQFQTLFGLEVAGSFRRHEDDFVLLRDDPDFYRNEHVSSQGGGEVVARAMPAPGLNLAFGGEAYNDFLTSSSLGDRGENRGALFGEAVVGKGGRAVLVAGLRQDWHQGYQAFLSPSLSGSFQVGPTLRLRAAGGRSFRAPTWTERYYSDPVNMGRADLNPEEAWSGEVGVDLSQGKAVELSVSGFLRRSENLIDWAREAGAGDDIPWETRNVEEATFKGLEADLILNVSGGVRLSLGGMALSVDSDEADGFLSKYALRPLTQRVVLGLGKALPGGISVGLKAQRARRSSEDAYHLVDLRTSLPLGSGRLYLDGTNLLDSRYPDVTGAWAPGRAVFIGMEVGTAMSGSG